MPPAKKVNERSTKTEIWAAYQELLKSLQEQPVTVNREPAKLQKLTNVLSKAKAELVGQFESALESVDSVEQAYQSADIELLRHKQQILESLEQEKRGVETAIALARERSEQERADNELARQREEEAYQYDLAKKRREEEENYARKAKEKEAVLNAREQKLQEQEAEVTELKQQVEAFPVEMEEELSTAKTELAEQLNAKREAEVKEVKQTSEHEKSILNLRLRTSEETNSSLAKQVAELQRQLDTASSRLKDMAVAVIQSGKSATSAEKDNK